MEINVECGDLLLVCRPCQKMDPISMTICFGAKMIGNSEWDHLGIVVEDPQTRQLFLLEANIGGVTVHPLHERITRSKASLFAVRKLIGTRDETFKQSLWELARRYQHRKYNDSFANMVVAAAASYHTVFDDAHDLTLRLRALQAQLNIITQHEHFDQLASHSQPSLLQCIIHDRRSRLVAEIASVELQIATLMKEYEAKHAASKEADPAAGRYFCSQLVAEVLMELDAMGKHRLPHHFIPADFSSSSLVPTLTATTHASEYRYSCDLTLRKEELARVDTHDGRLTLHVALPKAVHDVNGSSEQVQRFKWTMNVGDVLPPCVTSQVIRLADEYDLDISGDLHVLTPAHRSDHIDTQDATILGVLRPDMDTHVSMELLKACQAQHADIYLQAEARSSLTIRSRSEVRHQWTTDEVALQQQAFVLQDAWDAVWAGALQDPRMQLFGGGITTLEDLDIKAFMEVLTQVDALSAQALHDLETVWELFEEIFDWERLAGPDPFQPKQHAAPQLQEVLLLFALFDQYLASPHDPGLSLGLGVRGSRNQRLFEYFVRRFVRKYHRPHPTGSADRLADELCTTTALVRSTADVASSPPPPLLQALPLAFLAPLAWQRRPRAACRPTAWVIPRPWTIGRLVPPRVRGVGFAVGAAVAAWALSK